ncbi:MAG TPA: hypothetical protein VFR58_01590 [Flavisolibacter sp.]|nr:hypothetical protein [Flavisolibacter sp.]
MDRASNKHIYGYSWYLDHMAVGWAGLVLNDYEAVMPLPTRKKWGIRYLYEPFLVAQGGLFASKPDAALLEAFLKTIPSVFKWWEFPLNHQNLFDIKGFPLYSRNNYVLDLDKPYETLFAGYRENIRRNIRKSAQMGCYLKKDIPAADIVHLALQFGPAFHESDQQNFLRLFSFLHQKGAARTYGILSKQHELISSAVFFYGDRRAYYILVGNHPNGRTLGSSHALVDAFIQDHAGKDMVLDFEGSDLRSLAFFYSSFGARQENYAAIRMNRLPWYARWMKKE